MESSGRIGYEAYAKFTRPAPDVAFREEFLTG